MHDSESAYLCTARSAGMYGRVHDSLPRRCRAALQARGGFKALRLMPPTLRGEYGENLDVKEYYLV